MWKTVLFLLITIIIVPFVAFKFDEPLDITQKAVLTELVIVYLAAAALCFIISTLSKNYSQVDKLWSLLPIAYTWIVSFRAGNDPRLILIAVLVTIWGSSNFSESISSGKYPGYEDYKKKTPRFIPLLP